VDGVILWADDNSDLIQQFLGAVLFHGLTPPFDKREFRVHNIVIVGLAATRLPITISDSYATLTDTHERMFAIMIKLFIAIMSRRTIIADVVEAIIVGGLLAYFTANRIIGVSL
jgi:hypothetical protein